MGGYQVSGQGPNDDGYDEDGYDESQRAEILEVTRDGPSDGTILTDLDPDLGQDTEEDDGTGDLEMLDSELGEVDDSVEEDAEDIAEDEIQADLDDDNLDDDDDLDPADEAALEP